MASRKTRVLILCKTYPSPSAAHAETSCIAGIEENGKLVRLYPVPFRLIEQDAQFKKWQWITAQIEKASKDHRPESYRIGVDTITCEDAVLSTRNSWAARREWLDKLPMFLSPVEMEQARLQSGLTLALLRPIRISGLDVTPTKTQDWTEDEKDKLLRQQRQATLFASDASSELVMLRKIPFDFHYRYTFTDPDGHEREERHKIVDWEAGALYWNVQRTHGKHWEVPFRQKLERKLPSRDLMFLMGTIHRFPDQWLIVSLIYPSRRPAASVDQLNLL
ncbi:MAG: hypothetical protein JO056_12030 [Alphaproteobacteria bacterium]|nr:hypothetical protein [Alphaproteobacteria bacterium]